MWCDTRKHHVARSNILSHELSDIDVVCHQDQRLAGFGWQFTCNQLLQLAILERSFVGFVEEGPERWRDLNRPEIQALGRLLTAAPDTRQHSPCANTLSAQPVSDTHRLTLAIIAEHSLGLTTLK